MSEDLTGILFMGLCGYVAMLIPIVVFKSARKSRRRALAWQGGIALFLGGEMLLGAGLQSPADYPIMLIPVVFVAALIAAHLTVAPLIKPKGSSNG